MAYFDNSATTPIHPDVVKAMNDSNTLHFGNPSSVHSKGRKSKALIENSRTEIAKCIGAQSEEIIFTGSGSESNNMILWSMLYNNKKHVITSSIEHPAITKVLISLAKFGISFTELPVDKYGMVDPDTLLKAIRKDTGLITIMMVNNEIGTIQPISELASIASEHNIPFHSDTVQALGKIPLLVNELNCDFLSFSAHKFYGPKGVGFLYKKKLKEIKSLTIGGSQESGYRAGTENISGIVGLAVATKLIRENLPKRIDHLKHLEKRFKENLNNINSKIFYNGHPKIRVPGLISMTIPGYRSDIMMAKLDRENLEVSSGSACGSGSIKPSKVLREIGHKDDINVCTLRISFGRDNSSEDIDRLANAMISIINE